MKEKSILEEQYTNAKEKLEREEGLLQEITNVLKDLTNEISFYNSVLAKMAKDNEEIKKKFKDRDDETWYPFWTTKFSTDKAHLRRCIEVSETKLRRLRGRLL